MGLRSIISSTFNKLKNQITSQFRRFSGQQQRGPMFTVNHNIHEGQGYVRAAVQVLLHRDVSEALFRTIGEEGVRIVQEELEPLSRSERTRDSFTFRYNPVGKYVEIYSDYPVAAAIQEGIQGSPSTDTIQEWMSYKSEFDGLTERESLRVAFAIRESIANNRPPRGNSTIGPLNPAGERRFDYLEIVERRMINEVLPDLLDDFDVIGQE